jgi:hypothetical protein
MDDRAHGWLRGTGRQDQRIPEAQLNLGIAKSEHMFKIER